MREKWKQQVKRLHKEGLGYYAIFNKLRKEHEGLTIGMVRWQLENKTKPKRKKKEKEKIQVDLSPSYSEIKKEWNGNKIFTFGVVSDTHFGSKKQQLQHLNTAYDTFKERGISTVYNVGDLTEGIKMRKGHEYECFLHGTDEVEKYVVENYPYREGIVTEFITGNHDLSFVKIGGIDIGERIAQKRKDMIFLGQLNAKVFLTPNCSIELNHPLDGSSYALSYSTQKYLDSIQGGSKPSILLVGHHHKAFYLFYRNVHALEVPCLQAQTSFMRGKRISAHVGYYVVTVEVDQEGTVKRFLPEFYPFYEMIENDY